MQSMAGRRRIGTDESNRRKFGTDSPTSSHNEKNLLSPLLRDDDDTVPAVEERKKATVALGGELSRNRRQSETSSRKLRSCVPVSDVIYQSTNKQKQPSPPNKDIKFTRKQNMVSSDSSCYSTPRRHTRSYSQNEEASRNRQNSFSPQRHNIQPQHRVYLRAGGSKSHHGAHNKVDPEEYKQLSSVRAWDVGKGHQEVPSFGADRSRKPVRPNPKQESFLRSPSSVRHKQHDRDLKRQLEHSSSNTNQNKRTMFDNPKQRDFCRQHSPYSLRAYKHETQQHESIYRKPKERSNQRNYTESRGTNSKDYFSERKLCHSDHHGNTSTYVPSTVGNRDIGDNYSQVQERGFYRSKPGVSKAPTKRDHSHQFYTEKGTKESSREKYYEGNRRRKREISISRLENVVVKNVDNSVYDKRFHKGVWKYESISSTKISSNVKFIVRPLILENEFLLSYVESMIGNKYKKYSKTQIIETFDYKRRKGHFTERHGSIVLFTKTIDNYLECCKLLEDMSTYKETEISGEARTLEMVDKVLKPVLRRGKLRWLGYVIKGDKVSIAGFAKSDVEKAFKAFGKFKEASLSKDTIYYNPLISKFVELHYSSSFANVRLSTNDEGVHLAGNEAEVKKAKHLLERKKFTTHDFLFSAPKLSEYFATKPWKDFVEKLESKCACSVSLEKETAVPSKSSLTFSVKVIPGNICDETSDVIINGVAKDFNLNQGQLSRSLLSKAGNQLQVACNESPLLNKGSMKVTQGYNLSCNHVIHVVTPNTAVQLTEYLEEALKHAHELGANSVSVPTLGTGGIGLNPLDVAKAMKEALSNFKNHLMSLMQSENDDDDLCPYDTLDLEETYSDSEDLDSYSESDSETVISDVDMEDIDGTGTVDSIITDDIDAMSTSDNVEENTNVKQIRVVVFEASLLPIFQKEAVLPFDNVVQMGAKSEEWVLSITGRDGRKLDEVCCEIVVEQQKILTEVEITDSILTDLEENEKEELKEMALEMGVNCQIHDTQSPKIVIYGLTNKVEEMNEKIKRLLEDLADAINLSKVFVWKREITPGNFTKFPVRVSRLMGNQHKKSNKSSFKVKVNGKEVQIDFDSMIFRSGSDGGKIVRQREEFIPKDWCLMTNPSQKRYNVPSNSEDYKRILTLFKKSGPRYSSISKIERIQDKALYEQYRIKKKDVANYMLDSSQPVERELFHGTSRDDAHKIIASGFDRSFAGKNACAFGRGTYFAVDSSYSTSYSPKDASGHKYMFLALVLTGNFCRGSSEFKAAPPLSYNQSGRLYDSVVNDPISPSIFVVFRDTSVYPKYLITFR